MLKTRLLANVRVHIEGVIAWSHLEKFCTLMDCVPIDFVSPKTPGRKFTNDKKVNVCFWLFYGKTVAIVGSWDSMRDQQDRQKTHAARHS